MKRDWLILALWIFIFILIRSIHFTAGLNFSQNQAADSLRGLELLREGKNNSHWHAYRLNFQGRLLFQGPLFIYTYMAYNLLGRFDPIVSSYIFMLTDFRHHSTVLWYEASRWSKCWVTLWFCTPWFRTSLTTPSLCESKLSVYSDSTLIYFFARYNAKNL